MDREEILAMGEDRLLDLVREKLNVSLGGLEDTRYLSTAWRILRNLEEKGWTFNITTSERLKNVDGHKFEGGGPGTIFAQYGTRTNFGSITEGICRTALIACTENG